MHMIHVFLSLYTNDCHLIIANIIYFLIYFMKKKNIIDFNQHFMLSF